MPPRRRSAEDIGLPPRPFFYTIDQIALLISMPEARIKSGLLYYDGRTPGLKPTDMMRAVNIAPASEKPEWRVNEQEFVRWLRYKGYTLYEMGIR